MSAIQEDSGPNVIVQDIRRPHPVSSSNLGLEVLQNIDQDTRNESTTFAENFSPVSRSSSPGSNRISAASTPQKSSSFLGSNVVLGRYSPKSNSPSDEKNKPGRSHNASAGYFGQGQDSSTNPSAVSHNNEHRPSRVSFNTASPRSYDASPSARRRSRSDDPSPPARRRSWTDDDDNDSDGNMFSEKSIRHAFIRKVYLIVMCMLIIVSAVVSFMMFHIPTQNFVLDYWWMVYVAWAAYVIFLMIFLCCEKARRSYPCNYIVLFLMTVMLSFMVGITAAHFERLEVLMAFGITAGVCLVLTLFAFQTKCDFTALSGFLLVGSILLAVIGIVAIFWIDKIVMIAYSCLGAFLACMYFIFDTQMMMGGKHRYAVDPEEYIFAAMTLFTDMILIFILILNIIGLSKK